MNQNIINYSLLCKSCNNRILNLITTLSSSDSFEYYSRKKLIDALYEHIHNRKCETCGVDGNYAVWEIWCVKRPKQIHIQLQNIGNESGVSILDENQNFLNERLRLLPPDDPLCQLLIRALRKINIELNSIIDNTTNNNERFTRNSSYGDIFYCIYEERENNSNTGDIVFVDNNFNYTEISDLLTWIRQVHVFKH